MPQNNEEITTAAEEKRRFIMSPLRHAFEQPFILATGLAALAHSTWALGTLFTGKEPIPFTWEWLAWVTPAFLIAFALDVGQIATSADIRKNGGSNGKYVTFGIFAIATYYLQWIYMMHHVPALALGEGVRAEWIPLVETMRDVAIFFIPALLPLSTLLYTFSSSDNHQRDHLPPARPQELPLVNLSEDLQLLAEKATSNNHQQPPARPLAENGIITLSEGQFIAICTECNEWSKVYTSETSAKRGLSSHKQHCKAGDEDNVIDAFEVVEIEDTEPVHLNGNGHHSDVIRD